MLSQVSSDVHTGWGPEQTWQAGTTPEIAGHRGKG